MADIIETAITIDHETGDVYVDTRSRAFASMCRRAGLTDTTKSSSAPYTRFRGSLQDIRVVLRKKHPRAVAQATLDALKMSRQRRSVSAKTEQELVTV